MIFEGDALHVVLALKMDKTHADWRPFPIMNVGLDFIAGLCGLLTMFLSCYICGALSC